VLITLAGWQWWEAENAKRLAEAQRNTAVAHFNAAKIAAGGLALSTIQVLQQFQGTQISAMRVQKLAGEGRLTAAQQGWPEIIRRALAKLPPERADNAAHPLPWGYTVRRLP
jgi:hypothetical protein